MSASFLADLSAALLAGLFSSLHCIGMCGPLATVGCRAGFSNSSPTGPVLFVAGKFLSYSLLGLLAGWLGAALIGTGLIGDTTAILSLVGGIIMIAAIVLARLKKANGGIAGISILVARFSLKLGKKAPLLLGVSAALLPCGLLYAMVARSASAAQPLQGMTLMQAFGLGTTPALVGLGMLMRWIPRKWIRFGSVAGEVILALTALVLIWRGIGGLFAGDAGPACCE